MRGGNAQPIHNGGEFAGNIAAAHNQKRARQLRQVKHVVAGKPQIRPRQVRLDGVTAGRQQDMAGALVRAIGKGNRMGIDQHGSLIESIHPVVFQNTAIDILQPIQFRVQFLLENRPAKRGGGNLPSIACGLLQGGAVAAGKNHQFLRHTAANHTGAAIAVFFCQSHAGAFLCRQARGAHATRATPDNEEIIVKRHACFPLCCFLGGWWLFRARAARCEHGQSHRGARPQLSRTYP